MSLSRREFLAATGAGSLALLSGSINWSRAAEGPRPNIVWITAEDLSPALGCYGDPTARTPVLDRLAADGVRYTRAFANSPVCAPARFTLATGMYPICFGEAQDMRARGDVPEAFKGYPYYLRQAGYFCTNNGKGDYNSNVQMHWHEESGWGNKNPRAHWRSRPAGTPFFSVFNVFTTHESCLHRRPDELAVPDTVEVPPFYPDHPTVRQDIAWVYQRIAAADREVGRILAELDADGLADDTIVIFFGDHGGILPWSKRWLYERGTRVPLIMRFGKNVRHLAPAGPGGTVEELVSFVDMAPTMLSLAGANIPPQMQGRAFLGGARAPEPDALHFNRGRMDERYDLVRAVRDRKYLYLRNFWPFIPHGQRLNYPWRIRTTQLWQRLHDQGRLTDLQDRFFRAPRPFEELYDVAADPHQLRNLADEPDRADLLATMRRRAVRFALDVVDTGYHRSGVGAWGFHAQRADGAYPLERIVTIARQAGRANPDDLPALLAGLADEDADVRFWAACGCRTLAAPAAPAAEALRARLEDPGPFTQAIAAEALCAMGQPDPARRTLARHAGDPASPACLWALSAVERVGLAQSMRETIAATLARAKEHRGTPLNGYVRRLAGYLAG